MKDLKTQNLIKNLLAKIERDCLGQVLINTLGRYGISISYDPSVPSGVAEVSSGNIRWGDGGAIDYILFEELFHSYQIKSGGFNSSYKGSMEIEAKVAVWKYTDRNNIWINSDRNAWALIGEFADNPILGNYSKAKTGIAQMGYWEPGFKTNDNLYTLPNYNRINPCNN